MEQEVEEGVTVRLLVGDCRDVLPTLASESVHTVVTSPPYWGLRDYGHSEQIGLERDPREYLRHIVDVFREVRRVLRKDGTLWLNMGDSYTDGGRGDDVGSTLGGSRRNQRESRRTRSRENVRPFGLGKKQLIGMPWRVAFALQEDGWTLRSEIVWHKPNPMPESAKDRPTKAHEQIFLFSQTRYYHYDGDAIREPVTGNAHSRGDGVNPKAKVPSGWDAGDGDHHAKAGRYNNNKTPGANSREHVDRVPRTRPKQNESFSGSVTALVTSRNSRDVWTLATAPYTGAHFATFPPALAERCILAGTSPQACEACGRAWVRVVQRHVTHEGHSARAGRSVADVNAGGKGDVRARGGGAALRSGPTVHSATTGWRANCSCDGAIGSGRCVVLDPFGGAGTTGLVADRIGRDAVLVELTPAFATLARNRMNDDSPLFGVVE